MAVAWLSMSRRGEALLELWWNFDFVREWNEEEEDSFTLELMGFYSLFFQSFIIQLRCRVASETFLE